MNRDTMSTARSLAPWVLGSLLVIAAIVATVYGHDLAVPLLDRAAEIYAPCDCPPLTCGEA